MVDIVFTKEICLYAHGTVELVTGPTNYVPRPVGAITYGQRKVPFENGRQVVPPGDAI